MWHSNLEPYCQHLLQQFLCIFVSWYRMEFNNIYHVDVDNAIQKNHIKEGMFNNVISKYYVILDTTNLCICNVWSIGKLVGKCLGLHFTCTYMLSVVWWIEFIQVMDAWPLTNVSQYQASFLYECYLDINQK